MQTVFRITVFVFLFFIQKSLFSQPDAFFCIAMQAVVDDADRHFIENTNRDRTYLLNAKTEDRFEAALGLPGFEFEKVISRGIEGLYYEAMIPNLQDSSVVVNFLKQVDYQLMSCIPSLVRNPQGSDSLYYAYHYEHGDTMKEVFIRMWGEYPTLDADSFFSAGQINLEIYGDDHRRFLAYKPDPKKANAVLKNELQQIEKGLLDDIKLIQGKATIDLYNNTIYKTKVPITGAGSNYLKPAPENLGMPCIYFADFYVGENLADAKKIFKAWDDKIKNNAFADKRFAKPNRKRMQWKFLPYNELFDPNDYANIIEQSGYSCPLLTEEPVNRTPLFTYHLFILKYLDNYIVGLNIGNRF